jgi:hypothetical protein
MNQAVYTNDVKRLGNALGSPMIPAPPLKFRAAGFPQYGFKLELDSDLHLSTYTLPEALTSESYSPRGQSIVGNGFLLLSDPVQRPLAPLRVMLSRWIIAYYCLIRAAHNRLTPCFLRLSNIFSMRGSLLLSAILRAFNSGVTSLGCRVYLRGQQSIAAAGLTPARIAAL